MFDKKVKNIEKLKSVLSKVKYNGDYNDLNDIVEWLRDKYALYVWVERDTYWLGYRYVFTFDHPRGNTTGPCIDGESYYETLEDGVFSAALKLNMYIDENYRDYRKKLEKV